MGIKFIGEGFGFSRRNEQTEFETLTDLQNAYPNGSDKPIWVKSEKAWYYWEADTTAPAEVTNLVATNITTTGLMLEWTGSTSTDIASYDVYEGTTLMGNTTANYFDVSGLLSSTSYTFTIKAKDTSDNVSTGVSVSATTATPDTTAPTEVTNLTASDITATSMKLNWTASTSTDIASYEIYDGTTLLGSTTAISYSISNLIESTSYTFTVKSKDTSGNISTGVSVTATTSTPDTTAPADVTGLAVTTASATADLSWTASTSTDVANYEVAYSTDGTNWTIASSSIASSATTFQVTGLSSSTSYTFRAVAIDTSGNRSIGVTVTGTTTTADTTAPNEVTNLTATPYETSVDLAWTASTSTDIASYEVYNGSTLLADITTTSYSATGLTASTSYTFTVKSKDVNGNVSVGVSVNTTTSASTSFSPTDIAGLYTWYDANDLVLVDGASVTQWDDKSGNGKHGVQTISTEQPTFKATGLNSKPTVTFGSGKRLDVASGLPVGDGASGNYSIFAVATVGNMTLLWNNLYSASDGSTAGSIAFWNGKTNKLMLYNKTDGNVVSSTSTLTQGTPFIGSTTYDASINTATISLNGDAIVSGTTTVDNDCANVQIGGYNEQNDASWTGDISEIIVYNASLSDTDRRSVEQYLADKWGVTLVV